MDYQRLGLKVGLEIHVQCDTQHKLFCRCSAAMQERKPKAIIMRQQHPVYSELGELDLAAQYEYLRGRTFYYQVFEQETCLVDVDEEPPQPINEEALLHAMRACVLFNLNVPAEIHVMRKTVIDGSTPMGFQRTVLMGIDGWLSFKGKRIPISHLALEEDSAAIVEQKEKEVTYRLNRLGIPLLEVATGLLEGLSPADAEEVAKYIGLTCKLAGKIKRGSEAIRQDVNVSIAGGARVEIKGVSKLSLISKTIEYEVQRQLGLLKLKQELRDKMEELKYEVQDVTELFGARPELVNAKVYALKIEGFKEFLDFEVCKGRKFEQELLEYAGSFLRAEELCKFKEFEALRARLSAKDSDAVLIVAEQPEPGGQRIERLVERVKQAWLGVPAETRAALPDGSTRYTRPLPGAARMYPETDLKPLPISPEIWKEVKRKPLHSLEESIEELCSIGLSRELAWQLLKSEHYELFEEVRKRVKVEAKSIAHTLLCVLKQLRRERVEVKRLSPTHFFQLFEALSHGKVVKEAIATVLANWCREPEKELNALIKELKLEPLSSLEVEKLIERLIQTHSSQLMNLDQAHRFLMGKLMERVREKFDGALANQLLKIKLEQYFSKSK